MPQLTHGIDSALPPSSSIELGDGLGCCLAIAASFLSLFAPGNDEPRLFRVETEIARIPWLDQPASCENYHHGGGNECALLAVRHSAHPFLAHRNHWWMPSRWSTPTIAR